VRDPQKGQTSHPPTLAHRDASYPSKTGGFEGNHRVTFYASRFTVPGNEARAPLTDFFCILLMRAP